MDLLWTAQYGVAPALSMALLHSLWQGALLALLASLAMAACAGRSAALRHAIGMGFLLAMVVVAFGVMYHCWRDICGDDVAEVPADALTA